MKIGIIADIHNNLSALNAVIARFEKECCSEILCCGDILGIGPLPEETVQRLISIKNLKCVLGNHEKYLLDGISKPYPHSMDEGEAHHHIWEHNLLSPESKNFISNIPSKQSLLRENYRIYMAHYSMNEDQTLRPFIHNPTIEECENMFSEINADIVLYGHHHPGSYIKSNNTMYINPGSLGCPGKPTGTAKAGILHLEPDNAHYKQISVPYNLQEVIEKMDQLKYPNYEIIKKIFFGV